MVFGGGNVVHPFAVIRTDRPSIVDAKSKAQQVCAIGIDTPKVGFGAARPADASKNDIASLSARSDLIHRIFHLGENDAGFASRTRHPNVVTLHQEDFSVEGPVPT